MEPSEKDSLVQQLKEATQQVGYWKQIAKKTGKLRLRESENLSYIIQTLKQTKTQLLDEIAERKSVEGVLRKSEERHRLFFENSFIGIIHYNSEGTITAANDAVIAIFGSSREKLIGLNINDIPDKKFKNEIYKSLDGELGYYEGEYKFYTGGKTAILCADWMPIIRDGEVVAGVGLIEDVTEKKQAEEALRESEEKYRSMMEAMVEPTYICTSDFRVSYMNPAMIRRTGYDATDELCYKALYALNEQCPWCVYEKILQGEIVESEIDSPKDGRSFQTSNAPIFHQDGSISKITIYRDITEQKLAESSLIESERELKIKAKVLEELNAALKVLLNKRQEDKEELEESILSNVRTIIEPYIIKLKRSKLPQSQKTLLNIIESNLNEIVSPFTRKLSSKFLNLTPTQIQVANLVKHGKTNKDIAEILHIASRTVAFHRENIRKKLNLTNKKTNLKTYLMSMD
ncbi:MAG: PAS domain S-box protein [Thermodesulfobacteriota bacterium]|nr:PAS domain S-box protein [Thermodesulfobacteriota bacterium]